MSNMNIATFAARFLRGDFDRNDRKIQCEAGWYDWFCRDTSLAAKTERLGRKVLQLMKSTKIDTEKNYVFFKNNCPMRGGLYDDFRICDMETGNVIFTIVPRCAHSGKAEVWGRENGFNEPLVSGTWRDVKSFFGVK
jgi:hypothetical protein